MSLSTIVTFSTKVFTCGGALYKSFIYLNIIR